MFLEEGKAGLTKLFEDILQAAFILVDGPFSNEDDCNWEASP